MSTKSLPKTIATPASPAASSGFGLVPFIELAAAALALALAGVSAFIAVNAHQERVNAELVYAERVRAVGTRLTGMKSGDEQEIPAALTQPNRSYLVVSIADRRLELRQAGEVKFSTRVAVGMGVEIIDGEAMFFDTPRGRFSVTVKEEDPLWSPPDWHYDELSHKAGGLDLVPVNKGPVTLADGTVVERVGDDVGKRLPDGSFEAFGIGDIVVGNQIVVPPIGTRQRQYPAVLGSRRLKLEDGYAIHGTNKPGSIGRAASHGCIRVTNQEIEKLYEMVNVGTPVFIY